MAIGDEESGGKSRQLRHSSIFNKIERRTNNDLIIQQNNASLSPTTKSSLTHISLPSPKQQKQQRFTLKILSRCLKKQQKKRRTVTAISPNKPSPYTNFSPILTTTPTKTLSQNCRYESSIPHPNSAPSSPIYSPPYVAAPRRKVPLGHRCKIVKKKRRSRMRCVKKQEYNKLREMVPALQEKSRVTKVVVIEEAIKYIDELHSALVQRFRARDVPTTFNGVYLDPQAIDGRNIRDLVRRLLANANPGSLPPARIENVRTKPSFLQKLQKHKKT